MIQENLLQNLSRKIWSQKRCIDWSCFYYFVRNGLVALLEALCARNIIWRQLPSWLLVRGQYGIPRIHSVTSVHFIELSLVVYKADAREEALGDEGQRNVLSSPFDGKTIFRVALFTLFHYILFTWGWITSQKLSESLHWEPWWGLEGQLQVARSYQGLK